MWRPSSYNLFNLTSLPLGSEYFSKAPASKNAFNCTDPEDGSIRLRRNIFYYLPNDTALYSRSLASPSAPLRELKISHNQSLFTFPFRANFGGGRFGRSPLGRSWRGRQTGFGISRKMMTFCFALTVRENKNGKYRRQGVRVYLCLSFLCPFLTFLSQYSLTITCSAQNPLLRLINISLCIALRLLVYLTFFQVVKHITHVYYELCLGCMLENAARVSVW